MKKAWFILIVLALCVAGIGAFYVYDSLFPMAEPISCPDRETVLSVTLGEKPVPQEAVGEMLEHIAAGIPTRIMSVNERPYGKDYFTIQVETPKRMYTYHVYEEKGRIYVEAPYEGVYRSCRIFLDLLDDWADE